MKDLNNLISYYRACYQADNRERSINDYFGKKVSYQYLLPSAELLQGSKEKITIPHKHAEELYQYFQLHGKEKELICASFFLIKPSARRSRPQCIPLYIHIARISKNQDVHYLQLTENYGYINPEIAEHLVPMDPELELIRFLNQQLPSGKLGISEVESIANLFEGHFKNVDASLLDRYPFVWLEEELEEKIAGLENDGKYLLVPCTGIGLMQKSTLSRGVLNELESLSQTRIYSKPLLELFQKEASKSDWGAKKPIHYVPASLSKAQLGILDGIDVSNLNLVIGPPGTGKSFTIATIAIDAVSSGRSVLIASKTNQAVDVIANKLEEDFDLAHMVVRGGSKGYKKSLQKRLDNLLYGIGPSMPTQNPITRLSLLIEEEIRSIRELKQEIKKRERSEVKWGKFIAGYNGNLWGKLYYKWIQSRIKSTTPYWKLVEELGKKQTQLQEYIADYVRNKFDIQLAHTFSTARPRLQKLTKALKARRGTKKESFFEGVDFEMLLKALPIWLVNSADIHNVLPLQTEMFDVLVIDEATQCDIASSIPLMQRAKKTVIVGDPRQLRHVSFLSNERQQQLAENLEVLHFDEIWRDYRNTSILDLFSDSLSNQKQIHFLDEHYRSLPQIIQFSNDRFYNNAINIMTQAPHEAAANSIEIFHCGGNRTKAGSNKKEADQLLEEIRKIVDEEAELDFHYCQSIGILSPFRGQVDNILRNLPKLFTPEEIDRHNILVGTPYAFQGEERDIMMLSFTIDDDTHPSALHYLNREDVFNVAITRARAKQMLFCSMETDRLAPKNMLGQYLHYAKASPILKNKAQKRSSHDVFSREVEAFIHQKWDLKILDHYPIAGFELDMVLIYKNKTIAIDLVGFPGQFEAAFPIEKYNMLRRIGIEVLVLSFNRWALHRGFIERKLESVLNN